jgi:hypothetical protein
LNNSRIRIDTSGCCMQHSCRKFPITSISPPGTHRWR